MPSNENIPNSRPAAPEPNKDKSRDPLARAVEEALIDEDIPVETGVRPNGTK
jgi:hypothetical protein